MSNFLILPINAHKCESIRPNFQAQREALEKSERHWVFAQKDLWSRLRRDFFNVGHYLAILAFTKGPLAVWGGHNAAQFRLNQLTLPLKNLPKAFEGFKLLQFSDFHFYPETAPYEAPFFNFIEGLKADFCVITGDFSWSLSGEDDNILPRVKRVLSSIKTQHGFAGVLGNHDPLSIVSKLESIGVKMLVNEHLELEQAGQKLTFTGVDDPFRYKSEESFRVLKETKKGIKICLAHSPEIIEAAAEAGYALYLCGHTHGGQICLPGGISLIVPVNCGRKFLKGLWKYGEMTGYTNVGVGAGGVPVRFFCPPEIALFTLTCAQ